MKKKESMRVKILLLCLSSILIALMVQTVLFQKTSARIIYDQTKQSNIHSLKSMQEDIQNVIKIMESNLLDIYNQKELIEDLQRHREINGMREEHYRTAYTIAQAFEADDKVAAVYVYDDFNRIVSTYFHASTPIYKYPADIFDKSGEYNIKPLRRFMNREDNVMLISSYYNENRQKDLIRFAINIFDQSYPRQQIGSVVCDIDSDVFRGIIEKYVYGENNIIWVQPVGDRPLIKSGGDQEKYEAEFAALSADIQSGKGDSELNLKTNGEVLFNFSNSRHNLEIFSLMPPSLLVQNQRILTRNLILIAGVLLLVFGVISSMMAKGITGPLEYLTNTMRNIRKGATELRVSGLGNDEIGELGDNFNKMLDDMQRLIAREYQNQLMVREAEYKALQAQINPHFLYNTLDTMSSIAQVQDCTLVSNLSESLSAIFRYSLDMKNQTATVEKEILHLKNYIYVMDVRMNSDIEYIFEVEEQILPLEIPRLTLQPIVENALKYGVRDIRGAKWIKVSAIKKHELLILTVADNGVGMDAAVLNQQLQENNLEYVEKGDSIGLHNINARIKLLFGSEYGLAIDSAEGEGTKVTVTIPSEREVQDEEI